MEITKISIGILFPTIVKMEFDIINPVRAIRFKSSSFLFNNPNGLFKLTIYLFFAEGWYFG